MKNQKGITLIALVITIIVLLILAAVSITALTDDEKGVVTRAKQAAQETEDASDEEDSDIQGAMDYLESEDWGNAENTDTDDDDENNTTVTLADKVTPTNYGDVINYSANGISDWKIFYNDGSNVFIIMTDYMDAEYLPTDLDWSGYEHTTWPQTTPVKTGASDIDSTVADKFMLSWVDSYPSSQIDSIKVVASLMDTDIWADFAEGVDGAMAIGTPTLEMYVASWNAKGYTKLYCNNMNEKGYYIGTTTNPETASIDMPTSDDLLYYAEIPEDDFEPPCGMWFASPGSANVQYLMSFGWSNKMIGTYFDDTSYLGNRVVVCLPEGTLGTKTTAADGTVTWTIGE